MRIPGRQVLFLSLATALWGLGAVPAAAGTITLNDVQRGQFRDDFTFGQTTVIASNFGGVDTIVNGSTDNRRGFLTFDLSGVSSSVTAATLRMEMHDLSDASAGLPLTFRDYTGGNDADLGLSQSGAAATAIWADLADGVVYGTKLLDPVSNPDGSTFDVALTAGAIADINAAGGLFTIGIASDLNAQLARTRHFTPNEMSLILTTSGETGDGNTVLPEPGTLVVFGLGVTVLGMSARRPASRRRNRKSRR